MIFEKAFKTWSVVANLTFTQIHSEDFNISIEFVPFDINTGSLAKAYPSDHIKRGVIEIDRNENWDFRTEKGCEEGKYSLLSVAIHEIGHALGLGESSDKDAVMYFRYKPLRNKL